MIRKFFSLFIPLILFVCACESDTPRTRNPFVPNYPFAFDIDLQLPMYNALLYPSNAILITVNSVGANGIIVFNAGGHYQAYEANCPNQYISACSRLEIESIRAICPCDELEYSLFTGLPVSEGEYAMVPYRVEKTGNRLRVWN